MVATVRYLQCKATSSPPPSAKPFTNANVGLELSPSLRKTSWPSFPIARACSRSFKNDRAERSAPAAKINGFPVIAIAIDELASATLIASFKEASDCGPKVLGRLWSIPLSKVISEMLPLCPNSVKSISLTWAAVITSSGAPSGNFISLIICQPFQQNVGSPKLLFHPYQARYTSWSRHI